MLSKRIFETDFTSALNEELEKKDMTVRELAERTGIPVSTLYKVTLGERDPRLSTVKKIVAILEPEHNRFIAIIAAKFLLDSLEFQDIDLHGQKYAIRGYSANSLEECIIAAARAEKDGACGIVCAPILASIIEKIVDIPVSMLRPDPSCVREAVAMLSYKIR
jgi:predicted transcriptional regulator